MVRETSIESYKQLVNEGLIGSRQLEVYETLKEIGVGSDYLIAHVLGKSDPNYVRPRRKELVDLGLVEEFKKELCPMTGRRVIFWKLVTFPLIFQKIKRVKWRPVVGRGMQDYSYGEAGNYAD